MGVYVGTQARGASNVYDKMAVEKHHIYCGGWYESMGTWTSGAWNLYNEMAVEIQRLVGVDWDGGLDKAMNEEK